MLSPCRSWLPTTATCALDLFEGLNGYVVKLWRVQHIVCPLTSYPTGSALPQGTFLGFRLTQYVCAGARTAHVAPENPGVPITLDLGPRVE
jgi:hypothetical protein